ncbi:MAG: hypothetical protein N2260_09925 [Syntrophobacterales bacterium]|nr:hypothetical protein [Syntrophobacterales bacterium]
MTMVRDFLYTARVDALDRGIYRLERGLSYEKDISAEQYSKEENPWVSRQNVD